MEKKRVFLAVPFSPEEYKKIQGYLTDVKKRLRYQARWVEPENLHLTVVFLGGLTPAEIKIVEEEAGRIISSTESFSFEFGEITWGPSPERARMVWLRGKFSSEGDSLKERLIQSLRSRNLDSRFDSRRLLPHINLARLKKPLNKPFFLNQKVSLSLEVKRIGLWESKLSSKGANYSPLRSFCLKRGELV